MLMPQDTYPAGYPPTGTLVETAHDGHGIVIADDDPRIRYPHDDRQVTYVPLVDAATQSDFKGWFQMGTLTIVDGHHRAAEPREETAADRIMAGGRTQPLTPVEEAFFSVPDNMMPGRDTVKVPINIDTRTRNRLRTVLTHDSRFNGAHGNGIGYSEFINRALDALGCEG